MVATRLMVATIGIIFAIAMDAIIRMVLTIGKVGIGPLEWISPLEWLPPEK